MTNWKTPCCPARSKKENIVLGIDARTARITELVCDQLELEPREIGAEDTFVKDLGCDSLSMIGLVAALEKEFKISIDEDGLRRMVDIENVCAVVSELVDR
jgi:acyl carrier protein